MGIFSETKPTEDTTVVVCEREEPNREALYVEKRLVAFGTENQIRTILEAVGAYYRTAYIDSLYDGDLNESAWPVKLKDLGRTLSYLSEE